jgi:hypothetical protein
MVRPLSSLNLSRPSLSVSLVPKAYTNQLLRVQFEMSVDEENVLLAHAHQVGGAEGSPTEDKKCASSFLSSFCSFDANSFGQDCDPCSVGTR